MNNNEFKKSKNGQYTVYTLESATGGSTSAASMGSVSKPMGGVQRRGDNLITQEGDKDKIDASKPRNFVAKNAKTGGAGAHKDKKKEQKQGNVKHKNKDMDMAEGEKTMSRAAKGHEKYGKAGMQALAKAGRDGASEKKLDTIRNRYDTYNEDSDPCWKDYKQIGMKKKGSRSVPNCVPKEGVGEDHEVSMASNELKSIHSDAQKLLGLVRQYGENGDLQAWQQSKITKAADYLNSVLQSIGGEQGVVEGPRDDDEYGLAARDAWLKQQAYEKEYNKKKPPAPVKPDNKSKEQGVAEGYYDLNDEGMQPIDLSTNPSFKQIVARYSQLFYQGHEGTYDEEESAESDAIEQYVAKRFGQKGSDHLMRAAQANYGGRDDGRGLGGRRGDNLGHASMAGGDFRTTQSGKMHRQDAKMMKGRVSNRIGRHPEPNLPEGERTMSRAAKKEGVAEGLSKRDQQDVAAIRAAIERLQAQMSHPNADKAAIQQSIAHEKKRLALYGVTEGQTPEQEIERLKLRQNAEHGKAPLRRQAATQARIRELEKQIKDDQGVSEGPELKKAKREYNQAAKDAGGDWAGAGKKIDNMKKGLRQKDVGKDKSVAETDGYMEGLMQKLAEKIPASAPVDVWVQDFQKADPNKYHQFKNKTPAKKAQMAVAASYAAKNPDKKK